LGTAVPQWPMKVLKSKLPNADFFSEHHHKKVFAVYSDIISWNLLKAKVEEVVLIYNYKVDNLNSCLVFIGIHSE